MCTEAGDAGSCGDFLGRLTQVSTYDPPSPPSSLSSEVTSRRPPFLVMLFEIADPQPHSVRALSRLHTAESLSYAH